MKKSIILLSAFACGSLLAGGLGNRSVSVKADYTNPDYTNIPALGEVSSDSYITPIWTSQVGSRRLDDKRVLVHDMGGWGYRAQVPGRKFDISNFTITLDLEGMSNNNALMLIFGSAPGSYSIEATKLLTMDIVKATASNDLYQSTVSTCSDHNTSIPSYTDGQKWADDANYTGVQANAVDNKVTISIKKDNAATSTITFNDVETVVQNDELYEKCTDGTQAYFALGFVNGAFGEQTYIVENIGDDSDKLYMSGAGDFGITKKSLESLKAINFETADVDAVLEAKKTFDAIPYSSLYSYDKNYFAEDYQEVKTKVDAAVKAAGPKINLALLSDNVTSLEAIVDNLDTAAKVEEALSLKSEGEELLIALSEQELTSDQESTLSSLTARFNTAKAKILPAIKSVYEASVSAYEAAANKSLANGSEYVEALGLKNKIPTQFNVYLSDSEVEAFAARISAANSKLDAQVSLTHKNWIQGNSAKVVTKEDGSLDLVSYGNYANSASENAAGLFNKEALSVRDFEIKFSIDRIPSSVGAWCTLGLMEQPAPFLTAEDSSVQNNKGIFFLFTKVNSQTVGVQAFIMTMTCNRFYDAPLNQRLEIPMAQTITLSFKEVQKTIAGVSGTYFEMDFNGTKFDQENITANKIRTALENREGYLTVGSSGGSVADPAMMHIESVNGFKPTAESIRKEITVPAPTSTDTEGTFVAGSTSGTVNFNLETSGESLKSVTVNGEKLGSTNYSFNNSKLTLKYAYLKDLAVGDYTVVATTDGGSVTWTLHIVSGGGSDPSEEPSKSSGCGGSIVATSAIVSVLSLAGLGFISLRKKEK